MRAPNKPIPELTESDLKRFWSKVEICCPDKCWEWTGATSRSYGQIKIKGSVYLVHRITYFIHYGEDPGDMEVCHSCDNTVCCNPAHLSQGTHDDNMKDMSVKRRGICKKGEEQHAAKLTEQGVREIRRSDETLIKLAKRYGVGTSTISRVRRKESWKQVD